MIRFLHLGGTPGLALSTSVVALFNFSILLLSLREESAAWRAVRCGRFVKIAFASGCLAGACLDSSFWMRELFGVSSKLASLDLAVSIPLGVAVYYAACRPAQGSGIGRRPARHRRSAPPPPRLRQKKPHDKIRNIDAI